MFAVTFPIDFGALVNIVFNIKVKIVQVIEWPYRSSHIMFTITSTLINKFWTYNSIPLQHMSFWCPLFKSHPTIHHPNLGIPLEWAIELAYMPQLWGVQETLFMHKNVYSNNVMTYTSQHNKLELQINMTFSSLVVFSCTTSEISSPKAWP